MDEVRRDIQQIRTDMGHTIEAIQERISPEHLMDQARLAVQEVTHGAAAETAQEVVQNARDTAAKAGSSALNIIRDHPVPVALTALGVGWFLTHRTSPEQTGQQASDMRTQIGSTMGEAVSQAQVGAQQLGTQAATQAKRAGGVVQQALQDNPLAVGAAALALGAIVGLAVPQTQQEHQLMGPTRDKLVAKAQDTAQDVAQRVQTAAQETAQKVQHVAQEARDAAQRTAQQEGLL